MFLKYYIDIYIVIKISVLMIISYVIFKLLTR